MDQTPPVAAAAPDPIEQVLTGYQFVNDNARADVATLLRQDLTGLNPGVQRDLALLRLQRGDYAYCIAPRDPKAEAHAAGVARHKAAIQRHTEQARGGAVGLGGQWAKNTLAGG